ncbi:MAG: putative Ig domain-containing protein [Nitrospiraceae bacterium]
MRDLKPAGNMLWAALFFFAATFGFNGCGNVNDVASTTPPPPQPGPLTILTSSPLPAGTTTVFYDITLAPSGGTPPYTWSLAPGSPALPNGLVLAASTGDISGTPTATGTTPTEFKLKDSTGKSVQKVLSITVNIAPTPLAILTNSLPNGSINQLYAFALSPTGGTTPYTWGLKAGSPLLPSGLTLTSNGVISGTPTVTSNDTHIFTLTDATSLTVEKSLQLSINAIPLSITTNSLPQGTANQSYSETLAATGGTGSYTWGLAASSPDLPTGLTLNPSTGEISGIPTGTSSLTHTFTVTDQTPPTPQTATKTLQLIIGVAPPDLIITTPAGSSLPSGSVGSTYNTSLVATGGTGAKTWSIIIGALPDGLSLAPSTGAITGTPQVGSNGTTPLTVRVVDLGSPQQSAQKALSITITLPAAPNIATTPLPAGTFNVPYNHTVSVTGGFGTLVWGVISGGLPPGLDLNPTNGNIFGTPTSTGSSPFTLRVTDQIPQSDQQNFTITINPPAPPSITSPNSISLPTGTVNQPYPNTQLLATGGTSPYTSSVNALQMPGGVGLDPNTGVISSPGGPSPGTNGNYNPTFTVTDSTFPTHLTGTRSYSLTINANVTPVTITTSSLPSGTVGQSYTAPLLAASGGTSSYNWSINDGSSLPDGLFLSASGAITGTPTTSGTTSTTFMVEDSTLPNKQSATSSISITINAAPPPLTITTTSPLPSGKVGDDYGTVTPAIPVTLDASGGTPPYTWSTTVTPPLPAGLSIDAAGTISGTPTVDETNIDHTFTVTDSASTPANVNKALSLTIAP